LKKPREKKKRANPHRGKRGVPRATQGGMGKKTTKSLGNWGKVLGKRKTENSKGCDKKKSRITICQLQGYQKRRDHG